MNDLSENGSALLVSVGILVLLFVLAVVYLGFSRINQSVSRRFSLQHRAHDLAMSGIEKALSEETLHHTFMDQFSGSRSFFWGEDWDGDGESNTKLRNGKTEDWNGNQNGQLDVYDLPARQALAPSLYQKDEDGFPELISIRQKDQTKLRGVSGSMPPTLPEGQDNYSLKIVDNSTKININSNNEHIDTIINNLYQQKQWFISKEETDEKPGDRIISYRDNQLNGQFNSFVQLKEVVESGGLTREQYQIIKPHLVLHQHTWVDASVIKPAPIQQIKEKSIPGGDKSFETYPFYHQDESEVLETQPRAPVNINRAPVFVLAALIEGLKARVVQFEPAEESSNKEDFLLDTVELGPITTKQARLIAKKIKRYRSGGEPPIEILDGNIREQGPFETWLEFEGFVDQKIVPELRSTPDPEGIGALLKANFNPNTRLARWNQNNAAIWKWRVPSGSGNKYKQRVIDKTDLLYHTTELTFYNTGYYEVESHGRVMDGDNRVKASSTVKSVIHPYEIGRHTNQRDFLLHQSSSFSDSYPTPYREPFMTYPETGKNRGIRNQIKHGSIQSSSTSGKLSVTNVKLHPEINSPQNFTLHFTNQKQGIGFPLSNHVLNQVQDPALDQINKAKTFFDFKNSNHFHGHGVSNGHLKVNGSNGGNPDPRHYADVLPGGVFLSSKRNRYVRLPTGELFSDRWWWGKGGAMSFWWKPRMDMNLEERHVEVEFINAWFLAENLEVLVPVFYETFLSDNDELIPTAGAPLEGDESLRTKLESYSLPEDLLNAFSSLNLAEAAGYHVRLYYKHEPNPPDNRPNGYYMDVSFELFPGGTSSVMMSALPDKNRSDNGIVAGRVQTILPITDANRDEITPKSGQWNHVVMFWFPSSHNLNYLIDDGKIDNGIDTYSRDVLLMTGDFRVNQASSPKEYNIWANQVREGISEINSPEKLLDKLRIHNTIMTGHIFRRGNTLYHNNDNSLEPAQVLVRKRKPTDQLTNAIWFGGSPQLDLKKSAKTSYFAQGTLDDLIISNQPSISPGKNRYEGAKYESASDAVYSGMFHRKLEHPKISSHSFREDHTLRGSTRDEIEVLKVAHTQYLPEKEAPSYFKVKMGPGGDLRSMISRGDWLGAPVSPPSAISTLERGSDSGWKYQLYAQNMKRTFQNTTPFLESVTIVYENETIQDLESIKILNLKQ